MAHILPLCRVYRLYTLTCLNCMLTIEFDSFSLQPNTFQLVIAYDPSRYLTFLTYVYKTMRWDTESKVRRSMIGYFSYKYTQEESLQLAPSMKSTAFRLDTRTGNTGMEMLSFATTFLYFDLNHFRGSCLTSDVSRIDLY